MQKKKQPSCQFKSCKVYFENEQELLQHKQDFHEKKFTCKHPGCPYKTTRKTNRRRHEKENHKEPEVPPISYNEAGVEGIISNDIGFQPPGYQQSTNEQLHSAISAHPKQRTKTTTQSFLQSVPEGTYRSPYASLQSPQPAVGLNNSFQFGWPENTMWSHPPMNISAEEFAAKSGTTGDDYTSTLGNFPGGFTEYLNYDIGDVPTEPNQFEAFEGPGSIDGDGGASYALSGWKFDKF